MYLKETFRFRYECDVFFLNTIPSSPLSPLNTSLAVVFAAKKKRIKAMILRMMHIHFLLSYQVIYQVIFNSTGDEKKKENPEH